MRGRNGPSHPSQVLRLPLGRVPHDMTAKATFGGGPRSGLKPSKYKAGSGGIRDGLRVLPNW
eukprot:scaffold93710_cov28-Tisochrysis_lutea.AAC.1